MAKARPGIDSVLGKNTTEYKANYDPSILAREPRQGNRKLSSAFKRHHFDNCKEKNLDK